MKTQTPNYSQNDLVDPHLENMNSWSSLDKLTKLTNLSTSDIESQDLISDSSITSNHSNKRSTHQYHTREALERQLKVLELSKHEISVASDAKSHAYKLKLKTLESAMIDLQTKNMVNKKEIDNRILKELNDKLKGTESSVHIDPPDLKTIQKELDGLTKLNTELLRENSRLRHERELVSNKLMSNGIELDIDESGLDDDARKEVEHPDLYNASEEAQKLLLEEQYQQLKRSFQMEKDVNTELRKTLQKVELEMNLLENQFIKLSNDTEITNEKEKLINVQLNQSMEIQKQMMMDNQKLLESKLQLESKVNQQSQELKILQNTNDMLISYQSKSQLDIKSLQFLEQQRTSDRNDFINELNTLKDQIQLMTVENEVLKGHLKDSLVDRPELAQYATLVAEYSLIQDQNNRFKVELKDLKSQISVLKSKNTELDNEKAILIKSEKDLKFHLNLARKELKNKVTFKINCIILVNDNKEFEQLQTIKLQHETQTQQHSQLQIKYKKECNTNQIKDDLLKELKKKLHGFEILKSKDGIVNELTEFNKNLKLHLNRKSTLIKNWKSKYTTISNELKSLKESNKDKIDGKVYQALKTQFKLQSESMKTQLETFKGRELQFQFVLSHFLQSLNDEGSEQTVNAQDVRNLGLDPIEVSDMAKLLSKQILDIDWDIMRKSCKSVDRTDLLQRLESMYNLND
ncbi:hypothetical protein BC833DRAFT_625846 [Globomyces pollinis-pini]|nr:hypothetical protein BC833DRAFT_625846 [Globomyces pollinis-pini]